MNVHTVHPDIHENGLADDCSSCARAAEDPWANLDNAVLRDLIDRTLRNRFGQEGYDNTTTNPYGVKAVPRSSAEARAMAVVMTAFERIGKIASVAPSLVELYVRDRWNVSLRQPTSQAGRDLAHTLNPAIGTTRAIEETCSLICRHARTHHALAEDECNVDWSNYADPDGAYAAHEARQEEIEARITALVEQLPETDAGPLKVEFQGDPRGATVKLIAPPPWDYLNDGWANEAIIVPTTRR